MRLKFGTYSKENQFNKNQPFRVAKQKSSRNKMLFFWPFWSSHITPRHPNPFNWSATHSSVMSTYQVFFSSGWSAGLDQVRFSDQGCAGRSFFQRGGAGRGEDKNPRGGAKVKIRGAGRGKRTRKSTDPKIWKQCVYCYGDICSVLWCFDQWKH